VLPIGSTSRYALRTPARRSPAYMAPDASELLSPGLSSRLMTGPRSPAARQKTFPIPAPFPLLPAALNSIQERLSGVISAERGLYPGLALMLDVLRGTDRRCCQ
jgi:hypothetical protein